MSWKLQTVEKNASSGSVTVTLLFTDGAQNHRKAFEVQPFTTREWFADQAQRTIDWLNARDSSAASVDATITPATLPVAAAAKVVKTARQIYADKLTTYRQLLRAIDLGIVSSTVAQKATLFDWLKANFVADYIDLF